MTDLAPNGREKPEVELVGSDGNAFAVLGTALKAMTRAGWSKKERDAYREEATTGDYDHLLAVTMQYCEVC